MSTEKISRKVGEKRFLEIMAYMEASLNKASSFDADVEMDVESGVECITLVMRVRHMPYPKIYDLGEDACE